MVIWYFIRVAPGDLRPLSVEEMESFWRGQGPLPADENRLVHYVGLSVAMCEETPMDIEGAWFARCSVREDGTCDQEAMLARVNARVALQRRMAAQGAVAIMDEDVLDATDLFTAKRLHNETRWEPTEADLRALQQLINERAGWSMV